MIVVYTTKDGRVVFDGDVKTFKADFDANAIEKESTVYFNDEPVKAETAAAIIATAVKEIRGTAAIVQDVLNKAGRGLFAGGLGANVVSLVIYHHFNKPTLYIMVVGFVLLCLTNGFKGLIWARRRQG